MNSVWRVNFWKLCLGIALIIVITKATSLLAPYGWYFKFSEVLYGVPYPPKWPAIMIKFVIPIVAGSVIGVVAPENPKGTAGAVGFSAAFILVWPALNDWAYVAHPSLIGKEYVFKVVYLLYCAAYYYLAIWGAKLATIYLNFLADQGQTREQIVRSILDWNNSVRPLLYGVIGGGSSFILSQIFSK